MRAGWLVLKAVVSPWLLLAGLVFFRALGFAVTTKHFVVLAYVCLFWSMLIAAYLSVLFFVRSREDQKDKRGVGR